MILQYACLSHHFTDFQAIPWAYYKKNSETNEIILDDDKNPIWEGYCIDLIKDLADKMLFEFEIVEPSVGKFGKKYPNGTWDGLISGLVTGVSNHIFLEP